MSQSQVVRLGLADGGNFANDTVDTIHNIWSLKIKKYLPIVSKENLLPVETQNEENTNPTGMFISVKNPDSSEQLTVSFQLKN